MTNIPATTMALRGIKLLVSLIALMIGQGTADAQVTLHEGDLLFCCTDSANAITDVTNGVSGLSIDHVAIVHHIGEFTYVIEAIKPAVCLTPIDTFMLHNPHVVVGRVNVQWDTNASVRHALNYVGKPYDDVFLPGDSALYCSELVQLCYVDQRQQLVFGTIPMSFHDASGQITPYWREFYQSRGMTVPEGRPGTNPGELSQREQVTIVGELHSQKR